MEEFCGHKQPDDITCQVTAKSQIVIPGNIKSRLLFVLPFMCRKRLVSIFKPS
jgi:hypothetical protein